VLKDIHNCIQHFVL